MPLLGLINRYLKIPLTFALTLSTLPAQQGIYVGEPKIYDNRSLTIMLEELNAQLAKVAVIDQTKLAAALGMLQGMTSRESSTNTQLSLTRPYSTSSSEGATIKTTETVPQSAIPANTDLGTMSTIGMANPNFGLAAQDVLSEQVNLQYQIFNLRMLLDRSLTDRIAEKGTKLSAVVGLPISLDPPRGAVDSAAVVRVEVRRKSNDCGAGKSDWPCRTVSLIAQMPQEKTYNAAALSRKSNAFGASAVAKVIQVGFSALSRAQTYFLYRDTDTIAFEGREGPSSYFGWEFRPILGRHSVSAGKRQMFAVIALDDADDEPTAFDVEVIVQTKWVKYQAKEQTVSERSLWFESFGGLIGKPVPPPRTRPEYTNYRWPLKVPTTAFYQEKLQPTIKHVSWQMVGTKEVIVSVQGNNFFSDTKVLMGGKVFDQSSGLRIKSEKAFDLSADAGQFSDALIQGRYGPPLPLLLPDKPESAQLHIDCVDWRLPVDGFSRVDVYLDRPKHADGLKLSALPHFSPSHLADGVIPGDVLQPVITLNGTLLPGPYTYTDYQDKKGKAFTLIRLWVSTDVVKKRDGLLTVRYPFWGQRWTDSIAVEDPDKYFSVTRLSKDTESYLIRDKLRRFVPQSKFFLRLADSREYRLTSPCSATNSDTFCVADRDSAILKLPENSVLGSKLVIIDRESNITSAVDVPPKEEVPKPSPVKVNQFDSVWFELDESNVNRVEADGQVLVTRNTGKKMAVLLTRALTQKAGMIDLLITPPAPDGKAGDGQQKTVRIQVVCVECTASKSATEGK